MSDAAQKMFGYRPEQQSRVEDHDKFKANYDRIFSKKAKEQPPTDTVRIERCIQCQTQITLAKSQVIPKTCPHCNSGI